jgi:predicted nuclease of restriction endonuclease-like RecB superfamily
MKNRNAIIIFSIFFISACSSFYIDIIQTGPWEKAKPYREVQVFTDRNKITKPFGAIAILHSERFICSNWNKNYLKKVIKKAAEIGSDAIVYVVDKSPDTVNDENGGECYVSAMAVRYVQDKNSER